MTVKVAQTFYVDKTVVKGADTVTLDCVDLYFRSKPRAKGNMSGITKPGVTLYIMATVNDDIPDLTKLIDTSTCRAEYDEIVASSDASIKTRFKFANPVVVATNKMYAIGIAFDGGEEYVLWKCKEGETIVGTNTKTAGATAKNVGKFFEFTGTTTGWKPLNDTDLKFTVSCCKFAEDISANTITSTYVLPCNPVEHLIFNRYHWKTRDKDKFKCGEWVFLETPVMYGTITVNAASLSVKANGSNINFSTLFPSTPEGTGGALSSDPIVGQPQYIVLRHGSTIAANVDVCRVLSVESNTEILVDRLPKFSSNAATFSITAVGRLAHKDRYFYTGRLFDHTSNTMVRRIGHKTEIMRLDDSNANSTIRFVNNMVEEITISSGGTGYSNSDVITIYPVTDANTANVDHIDYIPSYTNAVANVVTNGSGTITGIAITNAGHGIQGNVAISIATSGGTSANLIPTIGATLRGATSNSIAGDAVCINIPVHRALADVKVLTNQHHVTSVVQHYTYYTDSNKEHILNQSNDPLKREVTQRRNVNTIDVSTATNRNYVIASRSNEVVKSANVSIKLANNTTFATKLKSSSILEIPVVSNNAFTVPVVNTTQVYNYTYIVNNDASGEKKGRGAALARHVSEKVTFAENRNAEDIVVYCDVYRPIGTNIKVYARLHNKADQEAFDDKDWTELELKSNNGSLVSSLTDETDIIEYTYGLASCPASVNTISGDATVQLNVANCVGVGTDWTNDLAVNDVVKLYSPLFPENYIISVVRSITNNTFITLDDVIPVDGDIDGTVKIDLLGRPANGANAEIGNPFQAWTYSWNSHICRYYDSAMGKHDTYNTFQIKMVLLSNNESIVPKVWNTRAVGVSA